MEYLCATPPVATSVLLQEQQDRSVKARKNAAQSQYHTSGAGAGWRNCPGMQAHTGRLHGMSASSASSSFLICA